MFSPPFHFFQHTDRHFLLCLTYLKFDNNEGDEERRFDKEEHGRSSRDRERCSSACQVSLHCQTVLLFPGNVSPLGYQRKVLTSSKQKLFDSSSWSQSHIVHKNVYNRGVSTSICRAINRAALNRAARFAF